MFDAAGVATLVATVPEPNFAPPAAPAHDSVAELLTAAAVAPLPPMPAAATTETAHLSTTELVNASPEAVVSNDVAAEHAPASSSTATETVPTTETKAAGDATAVLGDQPVQGAAAPSLSTLQPNSPTGSLTETAASDAPAILDAASVNTAMASSPTTLIFVDSRVTLSSGVLNDLAMGADVHVLSSDSDGVAQISAVLAGRSGVESLQIVAHGSSGGLVLGSSAVNLATLDGMQGALAAGWASHLTATADVLLWACDVGSNDGGAAFLSRLGSLTQADIAASINTTGRGGDWVLEATTGAVDLSGTAATSLHGVDEALAAPTVTIFSVGVTREVGEDSTFSMISVADGSTAANPGGNKIFDLAQTTYKGASLTISGPSNVAVQLSVVGGAAKGTFILNATAGTSNIGFDHDGSDGVVKLVGSLADVNAAIKALSFIPASGVNSAENSTISTTADDNQNAQITVRAWEVTDTVTWAIGADSGNQTVEVGVTAINDAPSLKTEGDAGYARATTLEGAAVGVTLGDTNFQALDLDTKPVQIVYTVTAGPSEGALWFTQTNGTKIAQLDVESTFTQQDLSLGKVRYFHGGAQVIATTTDFFRVTIEDGASGKIGATAGDLMTNTAASVTQGTKIFIDITPKNDAPTLTLTQGPVFENYTNGAGVPGTSLTLAVGDADDSAAGDHTVKFTALPTASIDPDGSGAAAATTVAAGTLMIDQGVNGSYETAVTGVSYSKAELATLRYVAPSAEVGASYDNAARLVTNPVFTVEVTDAGGGAGAGAKLTTSQTFTINVASVNDDPVLTTDADNNKAIDTNPVTINRATSNVVTFTTALLSIQDADSSNQNRFYEVSQLPTSGVIALNIAGVEYQLRVGDSFTQQDVIDGKVKFYDTGSEMTEQIKLKVSDGGFNVLPGAAGRDSGDPGDPATTANNVSWRGEHTINFTVTGTATPGGSGPGGPVDAPNFLPLQIGSPALKITGIDESGVASTATISPTHLNYGVAITGTTYLDPSKIIYTITQTPGDGVLQVSGLTIGAFGAFTQADVDAGIVKYVHGGSEGFLDSFKFRVSAGATPTAETTFELFNNPVNDAPVAGQTSLLTVKEGGTVGITTAHMSVTDVDGVGDDLPVATGAGHDVGTPANSGLSPDALTFQVTSLPTRGALQWFDGTAWQAVLQSTAWTQVYDVADIAANKFRYVHDGTENYTDSYAIQGRDDGKNHPHGGVSVANPLTSAVKTINIGISPVNDAPIAAKHAFQFLGEGQSVTLTSAAASVATPGSAADYNSDADVANAITVGTYDPNLLFTDSDNPTVNTNNPSPGTTIQVQYVVTQGVSYGQILFNGKAIGVGASFTQDDVDSGRLVYKHDGSQNYVDEFKFVVRDGNKTTAQENFKFFIDSALRTNDAPEVTASPNGPIKVVDNSAFVFSGANKITIADKDLQSPQGNSFDLIRVSLSATKVTGGAAQGDFILGATTGLTIIDDATVGAAGTGADGVASTIMVQGSRVDVQTWLDQLQYKADAAADAASDADAKIKIDLKITDRALGAAVDWSNATAASAATAFTNFTQANQNLDASNNGGRDPVTDPGYTTNYNIVTKSFEVWASAHNDAPILTMGSANQTAAEDAWQTISGLSFTDAEGFFGETTFSATVVLSTDGQIKFTPTGGATVSGDASGATPTTAITAGTKTVTITGSADAVQSTLATMQFRSSVDQHANGATIAVTISDGGNVGQGGAMTSATQTVTIDVTPVNDPVTLTAQSGSTIQKIDQTTENNGVVGATAKFGVTNPLVFSTATGNRITFADLADEGQTPFTDKYSLTITSKDVATSLSFGTLTAATTAGLDGASDINGTDGSITLIGSKADVQSAIDGLKFEPSDYNSDKTVQIVFTINDLSNGGTLVALGAGAATTDAKTITVQVSGTNDAPTLTAPATLTGVEDQTFNLPAGTLMVNDPDDFGGQIWATVVANKGVLSFNGATTGVNGAGFDLDGSDGTIKLVGTKTSINAALNQLQFSPLGNGGGADMNSGNFGTLTFTANDQGNLGTGGALQATTVVTLAVSSVNDAPTRLAPTVTLVSTAEDAASPGRTVTSLFNAGVFSDAADNQTGIGGSSANALAGVAVVGNAATAAQGVWQYSTDGTTWSNLPTGSFLGTAVVLKSADQLRFNPTADWNGTPGQLSVRLIDDSSGAVTTTTGVDLTGAATGGTTKYANLSNQVGLAITVDPVNDAPTRTAPTATLAAITEDTITPTGDTVSNLLATKFSDATDAVAGGSTANGFTGVAISANAANAATEGVWQYKVGAGTWTNFPTVSTGSALVLASTDQIRFVPVANYNGSPGALDVRLIDGSQTLPTAGLMIDVSGASAGGTTAIGNAANLVTLGTSVTSANDAPTLTAAANAVLTIPEDSAAPVGAVGSLVSSLVGLNNDVDAGAVKGVAVTATAGGTWWYSTNNGGTWTAMGAVSDAAARLLAADANTRIYLQPAANENGVKTDALTFRAWDTTSGANGGTFNASVSGGATAFSPTTAKLDVSVTAANDAPTRLTTTVSLANTAEDVASTGRTVTSLFNAGVFSDAADNQTAVGGTAANALAGVAIVANAATATQGVWQYSMDGTTWINLPTGSFLGAAVVLKSTDQLRFNPTADWNGTPGQLSVRLIDDSSGAVTTTTGVDLSGAGTGGTTKFANLANEVALAIVVDPVNDAPTRTAATATLAAITEDTVSPPGDTISNLLAARYSDATDAVAGGSTANSFVGVAITGNTANPTTEGVWQYRIGAGAWTNLPAVSTGSALVLAASDQLRFVPVANYFGTPGGLDLRLIDASQALPTAGTTVDVGGANAGGTTTISSAANAIALGTTVTSVNDAPTLTPGGNGTLSVPEASPAPVGQVGSLVSSLVGAQGDVDVGAVKGVAVTATTGGTWWYSTDNGATWSAMGAVSDAAARLLAADASTRVYFQPAAGDAGVKIDALTFRAWDTMTGTNGAAVDTSSNGGSTAFSAMTAKLNVSLEAPVAAAVNLPPSITAPTTIIAAEDDPLTLTGANRIRIVDPNDTSTNPSAINTTVTLITGDGRLSVPSSPGVVVTGNGGVVMTLTGRVADINAALDRLVYAGRPNANGPDVIIVQVNDNANGGPGALSASKALTVLRTPINDAPVNTASNLVTQAGEPVTLTGTSIADIDAGASNVSITLSTAQGLIDLPDLLPDGVTLSLGSDLSGTVTLSGPMSALNTVLAQTNFVPNAGFVGAAVISLVTSDNGGTGAGGPRSDADTIIVTVQPPPPPVPPTFIFPPAPPVPTVTPTVTSNLPQTLTTPSATLNPTTSTTVPTAVGAQAAFAPTNLGSPPAGAAALDQSTSASNGIASNAPTAGNGATFVFGAANTQNNSLSSPSVQLAGGGVFGGAGSDPTRFNSSFGGQYTPINLTDTDLGRSFTLTPLNPLKLNVVLQDRVMEGDGVQAFGIPANAFQHTDPSIEIKKEATQPNGSPLPGWVRFDAQNNRFFVDLPVVRALNVPAVDIKLTGKDELGNEASAAFRVIFIDEEAASAATAPPPAAPAQQQSLIQINPAATPALAMLFPDGAPVGGDRQGSPDVGVRSTGGLDADLSGNGADALLSGVKQLLASLEMRPNG